MLKSIKFCEVEQFSKSNEFEKIKKIIVDLIVPEDYYEGIED
jgi:hypothetical protein